MKRDAFSIRIAAQQSGLTPFVIRAWERRHKAVEPIRTPSNQRRYTRENIERLTKLRRAVDAGYRIGDIAHMSDSELDNLVVSGIGQARSMLPMPSTASAQKTNSESGTSGAPDREETDSGIQTSDLAGRYIDKAINYIEDMNESGLEALLSKASIAMSQPEYLDTLILPLARLIGRKWHIGEIRISQEHMASWVIKSILSGLLRSYRFQNNAPMMVVTTPSGQRHEIGALAVALSGAHCGWNVTYLGPDLPAEEIAAMVLRTNASLVALSLVYPSDDPLLPDELRRLKHLLPRQVAVVAGGNAVSGYKKTMDSLGIFNLHSMSDFREYLNNVRNLFIESVPGARQETENF